MHTATQGTPRAIAATVIVTAIVAACSAANVASPAVRASYGAFRVTLSPDDARLAIAAVSGAGAGSETMLVEGLSPSNDVGASASRNDDAPPMTGFAVRKVQTSYAMQYGSFQITDDLAAPWTVARAARWSGGDAPLDLTSATGQTLATLRFARGDDDGHLVVDVSPGDGDARRFSWGFRCAPDDHFFGFGAQTWGVDARKETIPIWVEEEGVGKDLGTDDARGAWFLVGRRHSTGMPLPEMLSRRGFAMVAETDHLSTFALCSERDDVARVELEMPARVHLFFGPSPKEAIARKSAHFGRPRVPPAFAFAPWSDAIFGSANVRAVAKKLRDNHVPSSVVWTEDWRGGESGGGNPDRYALKEEWDVDRTLYPDFEQVASELHAAGFKWLVYFNSFVEQKSKAFPETAPRGFLIKAADATPYLFDDAKFRKSSLLDLSNPDAVTWAVGKMKAAIALGADGWMGDYGEWLPTDATLAAGSGLDLHNRYPHLWIEAQRRALDEAFAADHVERLSFVRSGWLGSAPLVDVFWPGDQRTDFESDDGMPNVVPMGVGAGLAGMSTYGSDIAGYQNATNGPSTKELFFRWTELGAWSPVMRTHHGSYPKLNWSYDKDDETLAHYARYARLHVALAPYLRGLAQEAHDTGVSIWRALAVEFPDDEAAWPIADEVMVGPSVLVAPVQAAGQLARDVYLPKGRWFAWSGVGGGGKAIESAGAVTHVEAPLGEIAVFARAGAIVPMYPDGVETLVVEPSSAPSAASAKDDRVVFAFAGASGAFVEPPDAGGLSYTLAPSATPTSGASWNGAILAACDAAFTAPCVETREGAVRAHVTGQGTLSAGGADLAVTGGGSSRALTLSLRY
jgi:alpha-glucosidase